MSLLHGKHIILVCEDSANDLLMSGTYHTQTTCSLLKNDHGHMIVALVEFSFDNNFLYTQYNQSKKTALNMTFT